MPHTADSDKGSVMFNPMPAVKEEYQDEKLAAKWDELIAVKADVSKALEVARADKVIGHSLGAKVTVFAEGKKQELLAAMEQDLTTYFIVSAAQVAPLADAPENSLSGDSGVKVLVRRRRRKKRPLLDGERNRRYGGRS